MCLTTVLKGLITEIRTNKTTKYYQISRTIDLNVRVLTKKDRMV